MKYTYLAPEVELQTIRIEDGILAFSKGKGGANASAMSQDDDLFDDWDF
ncbi:MAG: hypothetical protein IJ652_02605 [Bacteroidales bacterium]|nr:hypothetical protein [Bacteroidales bacterium]